MLADIRRLSGARTFPQFNREKLAVTLNTHNIEYRWFEDLGGRRLGGRRTMSLDADESPDGAW